MYTTTNHLFFQGSHSLISWFYGKKNGRSVVKKTTTKTGSKKIGSVGNKKKEEGLSQLKKNFMQI